MNQKTKKTALTAMFLALALILPLFTGQIPQIGNMLLPMHIPVILCGLICGWQYGLVIGIIAPVFRSVIFGMPPMFPTAAAMAFELGTYGFVVGIMYAKLKLKRAKAVLCSMVLSMISGRVVWGIVMAVLLGASGNVFTWKLFMAGAFLNAVPGIILQFLLIPFIMVLLGKIKRHE